MFRQILKTSQSGKVVGCKDGCGRFRKYIVTDPGLTPLEKKQLLTEKEYREMRERYGDEFEAAMGAEAIQDLLKEIDLDQLSAELTAEVEKSSGQKRVRILKRLEVVEAFRISGNRPRSEEHTSELQSRI